jgi:IclR family acetate operon transcriptional repressor
MSSVKRAIQVLDLLSRKGPLGVRAVAQQMDLPLGSVHRLLLDLNDENVVERTADGEWEMSFRLLAIAGQQLDRTGISQMARPFAEKIADTTRETVNIYASTGLHCVCVEKVRGNERMQVDMPIGTRAGMTSGGAGKAMLAYMNPSQLEQILTEPRIASTPTTLVDRDDLVAELGRIRRRGYSIDNQEVVTGVFCVSVPIFRRGAQPAGAISITGPSFKAPGPDVRPLVGMLNEACGYVSRRLGYAGNWPPLAGEDSVWPLQTDV